MNAEKKSPVRARNKILRRHVNRREQPDKFGVLPLGESQDPEPPERHRPLLRRTLPGCGPIAHGMAGSSVNRLERADSKDPMPEEAQEEDGRREEVVHGHVCARMQNLRRETRASSEQHKKYHPAGPAKRARCPLAEVRVSNKPAIGVADEAVPSETCHSPQLQPCVLVHPNGEERISEYKSIRTPATGLHGIPENTQQPVQEQAKVTAFSEGASLRGPKEMTKTCSTAVDDSSVGGKEQMAVKYVDGKSYRVPASYLFLSALLTHGRSP